VTVPNNRNEWRYKRTGSITGTIDWTGVSPREMQELMYEMLDRARVPHTVTEGYIRALNTYLYTGAF